MKTKKGYPGLFHPEDISGTLGKRLMVHVRNIYGKNYSIRDPNEIINIFYNKYTVGQACDILQAMSPLEQTLIIFLIQKSEANNAFGEYMLRALEKRGLITKELTKILKKLN